MSDLPIPSWLDVSTASFLSTPEDTTDTLDPRSLFPDEQVANNAPSYDNGSSGILCNASNALFADPLLYEDSFLPSEIDRQPPVQFQAQPTNQMPPSLVASSPGFRTVSGGRGFRREMLQLESAPPRTITPSDPYLPTKPAAAEQCPASNHTKATVKSNGSTHSAPRTRKRSYISPESLKCDHPDCEKRQPFKRRQDLRRNKRTIHDSPGSFVCPYEGCYETKNRKDNLQEHIRRRHQEAMSADESSRGS